MAGEDLSFNQPPEEGCHSSSYFNFTQAEAYLTYNTPSGQEIPATNSPDVDDLLDLNFIFDDETLSTLLTQSDAPGNQDAPGNLHSGECSLNQPVNSRDQQPVDAPNGRERGRPKLKIPFDEMKRCKGMTLKDAAIELHRKHKISKSTLARRVLEVTGLNWSVFRRTAPDFHPPM